VKNLLDTVAQRQGGANLYKKFTGFTSKVLKGGRGIVASGEYKPQRAGSGASELTEVFISHEET
jgi:hypothetical protein